jgi:hypothetical protein
MTLRNLLLIGGAALAATTFTPAFARQGRGADDAPGHIRRGRGADDLQPRR